MQAHSGKLGKTFESKFQFVFGAQDTPGHKDNNGTDTHMKLLAGKVLVATWSLEDARQYGALDFCFSQRHEEYDATKAMDWHS